VEEMRVVRSLRRGELYIIEAPADVSALDGKI